VVGEPLHAPDLVAWASDASMPSRSALGPAVDERRLLYSVADVAAATGMGVARRS